MRKTALATMLLLSSALAVGSAQAAPVVGWDFSQYGADGQLTTDGFSFVNTLSANYSSIVPGSVGAGFGTMFADGSFGASSIDPTPGSSPLIPTAGVNNCDRTPAPPEGCTSPNVDGPVRSNRTVETVAFDAHSALQDQGQLFANLLGLTVDAPTSVVFQADLSKVGGGSDWGFSMGARTFSGTSIVGVDFAPDCAAYAAIGAFLVTPNDASFATTFPPVSATTGCVRLNFPTTATGQAIIDNVIISATPVPEPGMMIALTAGAGWLWAVNRRRSRS